MRRIRRFSRRARSCTRSPKSSSAQSEELQSQNEELTRQSHELRNQSDALIEANDRKNHFLGVLAHELRNPLAPISNSIFILKRVAAGSEQALRAQAVIERQTKHMIRLIDDLLDITRISQGKIRVQSESQDLGTVLRNCLDDQSSSLEQSGLHLALDLPANPIQVRGDYTRLSQVIGNLLSNAIKFTGNGGTVSVSLREDEKAREAVLDVQDTGIGLDATLLPQLFQPFIQGPNAHTRTNGGLGLGTGAGEGPRDAGRPAHHKRGTNTPRRCQQRRRTQSYR